MQNKTKKDFLIPLLTVISDIITIEIAFIFSYWLRFNSFFSNLIPPSLGIPRLIDYVNSSLIVIPIWLLLFQARGMYKPRRVVSFSDEFFAIIKAIGFGLLFMMAGAFFYRGFSYSRIVFVIIALSSVLFVTIGRYLVFRIEKHLYLKGRDLKNVLIVGTDKIAEQIARALVSNSSLGYKIIGYCSVDGRKNKNMSPLLCLGSIKSVPKVIESKDIDTVLIALREKEHILIDNLLLKCQGLNAEMMMVPDMVDMMASVLKVKYIEGIPFLGIKSPALSTWNSIIKRTFDLFLSIIILLICSPLFVLIALLIKLDSKGPVFYLQERVGINGEIFKTIKFRSMHIDAEKDTGPVWSKKNDPRVTRVGKILRRFSLDELPQFINVLKGDMSIVGPRPERLYFVEQFKKQVPRYLERHRVKTGITGWAQVNGLRGNTSILERTKYDLYYVENWSLLFDIKIILKTIYAVIVGKNAY